MASHSRSASYDRNEDIHLCHVYLDISQNPIIGINQSKDQFWSRVAESYNSTKPYTIVQERNKRSLQCRMQVILHAVSKFRGCVRQIEILNPSGASEQDILNRATELLIQDKTYKKGFKFDHVWPILKDIEKFADVGGFSSQSDTQQPESPMAASPGLSSFSINLSDDNVCPTSSERPIGIKKSKLKRKTDDGLSSIANAIQNETQQIVGLFNNNSADRQNNYEVQMKKLEMLEKREQNKMKRLDFLEQQEENKILLKDLNSISDPQVRKWFEMEQAKIVQKRTQKPDSSSHNTTDTFGQYFHDLEGSGADLPDY